VNELRLNVGREARRKLAFLDVWDARHGDPDMYRRKLEQIVDLNERLFAEQAAELGYIPATLEGCIAVLHVACRILELIGEAEAKRGADDA
jgi:hypothetical protein